jgi:orotate phosphoribosyltransferase
MSQFSAQALEAADILLTTQSVLFNAKEPFVFTSGRLSPVYTDCRRLISFPKERSILMDQAAKLLSEKVGLENLDYIAGGETAGIPYAAFVAERLNKPMLYVRKKPKGFGRMAQIEGVMKEGSPKVILVEDLQTDGGSKKVFIDALRQAGAVVEHSFVIFHYGIFPQSEQNMKDMGVALYCLTNWWAVLEVAKAKKYFDEDTLKSVEFFLHQPDEWAKQNAHLAPAPKSA